MTYRDNMNILISRERYNMGQIQKNTTDKINFIKQQEKEAIENIQKAESLLIGKDPSKSFAQGYEGIGNSGEGVIPWAYGRRVEKKHKEGEAAAIADRKDQLARIAKLQTHLETVKSQDTQMHEMKFNMLLNGAYYEDADRFTKLSPHAQVGYAQHKLNLYGETVQDKLQYYMAKSEDVLNVNGHEYTPKSITGVPLVPLALKEHALNVGLDKIRTEHGINGFSSEMLELSGITGTKGKEQTALNAEMGKYRDQYTVQASHDTRTKQFLEFVSNNDFDLNRLLTIYKGTYDENLNLLNYTGAYNEFEKIAVSALLSGDITEDQLAAAFDTVNYDPSAKGKKFSETHAQRYDNIIREYARVKEQNLNAEIIASGLDAKEVEAKFKSDITGGDELMTQLHREGKLTNQHLEVYYEAWKLAGGANDGEMPEFLRKIQTVQEADQDAIYEDAKKRLKERGFVTAYDVRNATLDTLDTIKRLPGYQTSNENAIASAQQHQKGKGGWEKGIGDTIAEALDLTGDDRDTARFGALFNRTYAGYINAYEDYLNKHQLPPAQAHEEAMKWVRSQWGLSVGNEKSDIIPEKSIFAQESPVLDPDSTTDIGDEVTSSAEKIKGLTKKTNNWTFLQEVKLKKNKKDLIDYRDGKGSLPPFYVGVARHFPEFSVEDLINAQLIAHGEDGLEAYSPVDQALKVEGLSELRRRLGLKPTSASKVHAKLDAMDGESNFKGQTLDEAYVESGAEEADKIEAEKKEEQRKIEKEEKEGYDFKAAALEAAGPKPVPPKKPDSKLISGNKLREANIKYSKELKKYETDLKNWESKVEAMTPPEMGQGKPLMRKRVEKNEYNIQTGVVTEYYWDGQWSETPPEGVDVSDVEEVTEKSNPALYNMPSANEIGEGNIMPSMFTPIDEAEPVKQETRNLDNKVSYLQSIYNMPGSPVLSPLIQDYAEALYASNVTDQQSSITFEEAQNLDTTEGNNYNTWDYIVAKATAAGAKYPELVAAQFMLESGRGKSQSGVNNYFNLQTTQDDDHTEMGTEEWRGDQYVVEPGYFKNFESVDQSINYLVRLWYQDFGDYKGVDNAPTASAAAKLLQKEGFATEPEYAKRLIQLMKEFKKRPAKADLVRA